MANKNNVINFYRRTRDEAYKEVNALLLCLACLNYEVARYEREGNYPRYERALRAYNKCSIDYENAFKKFLRLNTRFLEVSFSNDNSEVRRSYYE